MDWERYLTQRPELLVAFSIAMCWVIMLFTARLTGWAALAESYRAQSKPNVRCRWFQSARTRWGSHYSGCLIFGSNTDGLYLSVLFPLQIGHSPLFIPWGDITVTRKRRFGLFECFELRFPRCPGVLLQIRVALGEKLAQTAGSSWPATRTGQT